MQWILSGTLTPAVAEALKRHGHTVHTPDELALGENPEPGDLLLGARARQWDILTNDDALIRWVFDNDFWCQRSMVYLQLPGADVEQDDAIDRLFARYKRLNPGRLYTVTETRVKIRQMPNRKPGSATKGAKAEVEEDQDDDSDE